MSEEKYYVIRNSDGDTYVDEYTKEQLLYQIDDYEWDSEQFMHYLSDEHDTNYWKDGILIIKGTVVVPKPQEVITKWDVK